ncbi:hypothetical protein BH11BAC4_BH11BAC4_08250 [soil metagenome]
MKLTRVLMLLITATTLFFVSCGPKDADIKAKVEAALKADPTMSSTAVEVKDGVVTISGECKDNECKANCQKTAEAVKGVKSVMNNCTVAPPPPPPVAPPASLTTALDEATQQRVKDGLKDIKGVTVSFLEDKAVLVGEVTKADRMKIMQMLAAAKVKSDVSKLTDKK